jgi:RNA polymerase sigma-70 factor (ECF subfamily)
VQAGITGAGTVSGLGPSDAALVVAARAGETWAKEALFKRHAARVNGLALRLVGRDADVDDLVQETFISAFASLQSLRTEVAFAGWLSAILCRSAYKLLRTRRLLTRLGLRPHAAIDFDALTSRSTAAPDVAAEAHALYRRVERWPAKLRITFLLRRVDGASIDEIAAWTGASAATVKRRLADAEGLLAAEVAREGES